MELEKKLTVGFAMCGSFCTFKRVLKSVEKLAKKYDIVPVMSSTAYHTDTRFGKAEDFVKELENISGKKVLHTVFEVEPFGPKKILDALVVAPCTGNTLAKLSLGIADTSVTLAVKAHLRNERPVIIAVSSNDALANNAKNLGYLLNMKNIYFVPFEQDDPIEKPNSLVAIMEKIPEAVDAAFEGRQLTVLN